jgi:hypothetical protein
MRLRTRWQVAKVSPSGSFRAVWRESVIASDWTTDKNELAVAIKADVTGPATDAGLGMLASSRSAT